MYTNLLTSDYVQYYFSFLPRKERQGNIRVNLHKYGFHTGVASEYMFLRLHPTAVPGYVVSYQVCTKGTTLSRNQFSVVIRGKTMPPSEDFRNVKTTFNVNTVFTNVPPIH